MDASKVDLFHWKVSMLKDLRVIKGKARTPRNLGIRTCGARAPTSALRTVGKEAWHVPEALRSANPSPSAFTSRSKDVFPRGAQAKEGLKES